MAPASRTGLFTHGQMPGLPHTLPHAALPIAAAPACPYLVRGQHLLVRLEQPLQSDLAGAAAATLQLQRCRLGRRKDLGNDLHARARMHASGMLTAHHGQSTPSGKAERFGGEGTSKRDSDRKLRDCAHLEVIVRKFAAVVGRQRIVRCEGRAGGVAPASADACGGGWWWLGGRKGGGWGAMQQPLCMLLISQ
eukprot:365016-Chlamydomonas_euryale.AAC.9